MACGVGRRRLSRCVGPVGRRHWLLMNAVTAVVARRVNFPPLVEAQPLSCFDLAPAEVAPNWCTARRRFIRVRAPVWLQRGELARQLGGFAHRCAPRRIRLAGSFPVLTIGPLVPEIVLSLPARNSLLGSALPRVAWRVAPVVRARIGLTLACTRQTAEHSAPALSHGWCGMWSGSRVCLRAVEALVANPLRRHSTLE